MTARSFTGEVIADGSGQWAGNGLRFATEQEARESVADLMRRWWLVTDTRIVQSADPPNYRWDNGGLVPIAA